MAITCKWHAVLGEFNVKYTNGVKQKITIYGGGNILCCMCYKNKNLFNFIIDKEHAKNMYKDKLGMENAVNVKLFEQRDKDLQKDVKELIKHFIEAKIEFTYKTREKENEKV